MESKIKIGDYVSRWDKNEAFKVVGILSKDCILIKTGKKYHGSWKMCENLQNFNEYISVSNALTFFSNLKTDKFVTGIV